LALQRKCRFTDGYVLEKRVYRGQTVVTCSCAVTTVELEVFEELAQEGDIKVFHKQFGRQALEALGDELEQEPKGVSVGCYSVLACTELL
jgi:hypothetical protein